MLFLSFQEIHSGCCTVAAQTLQLDQLKVRNHPHSNSRLKTTCANFVSDVRQVVRQRSPFPSSA
jgi:hypothetical protein